MKKLLFISTVLWLTASCKDEVTEPATMVKSEKIDYAYTIKHDVDNWDKGSQENVALVLNCLKAFETGNIEECMKYFADSVTWKMDYIDSKMSKDSLKAMLQGYRASLSSLSVEMNDWESVISKDKKNEWVGLWYKEVWTDKDGKTDSAIIMDDVKVENGKIVELDEKTRKFAAKK